MSVPVAEEDKKPLFPSRQPLDVPAVSSQSVEENTNNFTFGKVLTIYAKTLH